MQMIYSTIDGASDSHIVEVAELTRYERRFVVEEPHHIQAGLDLKPGISRETCSSSTRGYCYWHHASVEGASPHG